MKDIELKKRSFEEVRNILIEKIIENENLYRLNFQNCKHKSGWCSSYKKCKNCEYMKG